jgi:hypothetical protein
VFTKIKKLFDVFHYEYFNKFYNINQDTNFFSKACDSAYNVDEFTGEPLEISIKVNKITMLKNILKRYDPSLADEIDECPITVAIAYFKQFIETQRKLQTVLDNGGGRFTIATPEADVASPEFEQFENEQKDFYPTEMTNENS